VLLTDKIFIYWKKRNILILFIQTTFVPTHCTVHTMPNIFVKFIPCYLITSFFFLWRFDSISGHGLAYRISRSYWDTPHSIGLLWKSDQPVAETSTWQHTTLTTDRHATDGIRTRNSRKRAAADPRFRPRGHRDQLSTYFVRKHCNWL
jgi:hypothetical protein